MLSKMSYGCCVLLMLYTSFIFYPKWHAMRSESYISWDVSGYYWYLPSIFIYKDLKQQKFGDSIITKYQPTHSFEQSYVHESGNRVMNYSSGMALMYLPFFLAAHTLAPVMGFAADGFTFPYQMALILGSLAVALAGLWYLRKLFLYYFDDKVVAAVLFLLVFGTNYLNYSTLDGALTHNWLFTIYVLLLLNTRRFYITPSAKYAIRIGLLTGLAILIRPSEMVAIIIPLLWGMETISISAIKRQFAFLAGQWKNLLIAAACAIPIGAIQLCYWLYVTGKPLVYSYGDKGFSWLHPHWNDYMLSYQSGWLRYTPLAILFFIGILPFLFRGRNKVAILTFFALNLYVVSAWDIWTYGGSGGRAMIQSYPVLLFLLASLLQYIFPKRYQALAGIPVILLLAYFNIWITYNAHAGEYLYDSSAMSKEYYWKVIYRYHATDDMLKLKDTKEIFEDKPANTIQLYSNNFETDSNAINTSKPIQGNRSLLLAARSVSPIYTIPYTASQANWIRAQATFRCERKEWETWRMAQFVLRFTKNGTTVKENMIRLHHVIIDGQTKQVYIDSKIPQEPFDSISVFFWAGECQQSLLIDNLEVLSFNE